MTHNLFKLGIYLLPSLLPALLCCHTQDKWMGQAGRKGGRAEGRGEESPNILSLEVPHVLFRLLPRAAPLALDSTFSHPHPPVLYSAPALSAGVKISVPELSPCSFPKTTVITIQKESETQLYHSSQLSVIEGNSRSFWAQSMLAKQPQDNYRLPQTNGAIRPRHRLISLLWSLGSLSGSRL